MKKRLWYTLISALAALLILTALWGAAAESALLTVNGLTSGIEVEQYGNVRVLACAPATATAVRVRNPLDEYGGDQWDYADRYSTLTALEKNWIYSAGQRTFRAEYTEVDYEDGFDLGQIPDESWHALGDSVVVTVKEPVASLTAPSATLAATSVAKGGFLTIRFSAFKGVNEHYNANIQKKVTVDGATQWEDLGRFYVLDDVGPDKSSEYTISLAGLGTGSYRVVVGCYAEKYDAAEKNLTFKITSATLPDNALTLSAAGPVQTQENVSISMRASGAQWMELAIEVEEDPNWYLNQRFNGEQAIMDTSFDLPGTFHMTLTAHDGDSKWTAGSASLQVQTEDRLGQIVFQFPGAITDGRNLAGKVIMDSRAENYNISLHYCPENEGEITLFNSYRDVPEGGTANVIFASNLLQWEGRYCLRVNTCAYGLERSFGNYSFIKRGSGEAGFTLKVNGGTQDVDVNSSTNVHIEAVGVSADVTALRVMMGDQVYYWDDPANFSEDRGFGNSDVVIIAQATTDPAVWKANDFDWQSFNWDRDVTWGAYSNAVTVHVKSPNGYLDRPEIALNKTTLSQNEWLTATITNAQGDDVWYWGQIRRLTVDEYGNRRNEDVMQCHRYEWDRFSVPAALLSPGNYYISIGIDAEGSEGCETSVPFTVTSGAQPEQLSLRLTSNPMQANAGNDIRVFAKGADFIQVDVSWDADLRWSNYYETYGEYDMWSWGCSEEGLYTFTMSAWKNGQLLGQRTVDLTVTAELGDLAAPQVTGVPKVIRPNTALTGSIELDPATHHYGVQVEYTPNGEMVYDRFKNVDEGVGISVPADCFSRTGSYKLSVHAGTPGYNGSHTDIYFFVSEDMAQTITLKVQDGTKDIADWPSSQYFKTEYILPAGVTGVRFMAGGYWEFFDAEDTKIRSYNFGPGDYTLVVQGTTDEPVWRDRNFDWEHFDTNKNLNWTITSNAVRLQITTPNGALEAPQITLNKNSVAQGQWLTATVTPQNQEEWYSAWVCQYRQNEWGSWDWDHIVECSQDGDYSFTVPASMLAPGDYRLAVTVDAIGFESKESSVPFTVTQGSAVTKPTLLFPANTISTGTELRYYGYAPGADYMRVDITWDRNPNWSESRDGGGEINYWTASYPSAGAYTYTLTAWKNGNVLGTDTFTLTNDAPNGRLNCPKPQGIPNVLSPNTAVSGSFGVIEHAEAYYIELTYAPEGEDWYTVYQSWRRPEWGDTAYLTGLDFPAEYFSRTGRYIFSIEASAVGWDNGYYDTWLYVTQPLTQGITLTVNGGAQDIADWPSGKNVNVTIQKPADVTAVRIMNGDHWEYHDATRNNWNWNYQAGYYTFYAEGTKETPYWWADDFNWEGFNWDTSVNWSVSSNVVNLSVVSPHGSLNQPQVTLNKNSIAQGEWLTATVTPQNHGEWYGVRVRAYGRDEWGNLGWHNVVEAAQSGDNKFTVPTAMLSPGNYILNVGVDAEGWEYNETDVSFTVTAGAAVTEPTLYLTGNTFLNTTDILCYAYAPEADYMKVRVTWDHDPGWDDMRDCNGEIGCWTFNYPGTGHYTLTLTAWKNGNVLGTDSFEFDNNAVNGRLDDPTISGIPGVITMNTGVSGSFSAVENASRYHVKLDYAPDNGWETLFEETFNAGQENVTALNFPARYFNRAGRYNLGVSAWGPGYHSGNNSVWFYVREPLTQSLTLTVNGGTQDITGWLSMKNLLVEIQAPANVTAVRIMNGDHWEYFDARHDNSWNWCFNSGTYTFYAEGTTDDPYWWNEGFNWNGFNWDTDVNWTSSSNMVNVTVTAPNGVLNPPDVSLESSRVKRGEPFRLTINTLQNKNEWYCARLQDTNYRNVTDYHVDWNGGTRTILMDTYDIQPGQYNLFVWTDASGCDGAHTNLSVIVEAPENKLYASVPEEVLIHEEFECKFYAPGAAKIKVICRDSNGADRFFGEEAGETRRNRYMHGIEGVYTYFITAYDGNDQVLYQAERTIRVSAPYGDVPRPRVYMNGVWTAGEDLSFRVDGRTADAIEYYVTDLDTQETIANGEAFADRHWGEVFTVSASNLNPNHRYEIGIYSAGVGCRSAWNYFTVNALPANTSTLTLPGALKTVEAEAFAGVPAQRIVVPAGVNSIGEKAFAGCANLRVVSLPSNLSSLPDNAFDQCGGVTVYGPAGCSLEGVAIANPNLTFICLEN